MFNCFFLDIFTCGESDQESDIYRRVTNKKTEEAKRPRDEEVQTLGDRGEAQRLPYIMAYMAYIVCIMVYTLSAFFCYQMENEKDLILV